MTSFRQIEANRRDAVKSTGPITEEGKHRSRQNAVRHGLCGETVVEIVEDIEDYRGFEARTGMRITTSLGRPIVFPLRVQGHSRSTRRDN